MIKRFKIWKNSYELWIDYPKFGDIYFSLLPNIMFSYHKWDRPKLGGWSRKIEKSHLELVIKLLFIRFNFRVSFGV